MFRLCTNRLPTDEETTDLVTGFSEDLAVYQKNQEAAAKLIAIGAVPVDKSLNAAELAAWTVTANLMLNLDVVLNK